MSHPDPCFDPENSYEDDDMGYHDDTADYDCGRDDHYDDSMDGDFDSAMRDAGFGTDEDYGLFDSGEDF
jgi:hypothetical protein